MKKTIENQEYERTISLLNLASEIKGDYSERRKLAETINIIGNSSEAQKNFVENFKRSQEIHSRLGKKKQEVLERYVNFVDSKYKYPILRKIGLFLDNNWTYKIAKMRLDSINQKI